MQSLAFGGTNEGLAHNFGQPAFCSFARVRVDRAARSDPTGMVALVCVRCGFGQHGVACRHVNQDGPWQVIAWLSGAVGRAIAGLVLVAGILAGVWASGRQSAKRAAQGEALRRVIKTTERMGNADIGRGDPDADAKWLRERSGK